MGPLKFNKLLLTWLSMCASDECKNKESRIGHVGLASTIFAFCLFALISNTVYIIFMTTDLKVIIFEVMSVSAYSSILYALINAFSLRYKINEMLEKLAEICNGCEWILFVVQFENRKY